MTNKMDYSEAASFVQQLMLTWQAERGNYRKADAVALAVEVLLGTLDDSCRVDFAQAVLKTVERVTSPFDEYGRLKGGEGVE